MKSTDEAAAYVQHLTGCQSRLYAYLVTLLGGSRDVADVLQQTNAVLWKKMHEYDATRPFLPWAYGFAYLQVMAYRKNQTRERLLFDDELLSSIAAEYERQDQSVEHQLAALEDCLMRLPERQRHLIDKRYRSGASVSAIAEQEGTDAGALSALLYRVRQALAECIRRKLAAGEVV